MPQPSLLFASVTTILSSIPTSLFLKELKDDDKRKAVKLLAFAWLSLIIAIGLDYLFNWTFPYFLPFGASIFHLAFCFWNIKWNKIKDKPYEPLLA